jgi:hypothetical protein
LYPTISKSYLTIKIYVAGATSIILLFIVIRPLTASIIDIVPSAVNQEKTGELTCNLNFILIVAPVKSKLKMICLFLKVSPIVVGKIKYSYHILFFSCNY